MLSGEDLQTLAAIPWVLCASLHETFESVFIHGAIASLSKVRAIASLSKVVHI
jgi:hypothetical protein